MVNVESFGVPVIPCGPLMITSPSVHVQRHGILHGKMETICIFSDKEYVDQVLDDLTKCQGNDRQVVTFQSQYRDSDDQSEQSRNSSSDQQCQKETKSIRHHSCGAF